MKYWKKSDTLWQLYYLVWYSVVAWAVIFHFESRLTRSVVVFVLFLCFCSEILQRNIKNMNEEIKRELNEQIRELTATVRYLVKRAKS